MNNSSPQHGNSHDIKMGRDQTPTEGASRHVGKSEIESEPPEQRQAISIGDDEISISRESPVRIGTSGSLTSYHTAVCEEVENTDPATVRPISEKDITNLGLSECPYCRVEHDEREHPNSIKKSSADRHQIVEEFDRSEVAPTHFDREADNDGE